MYSFPVEADENIVKKGLVNLEQNGESFSGALYLTTARLVFVGYLHDITHKYLEEVPLAHISEITQGKSLFIIPNVMKVVTIQNKTFKFVMSGRNGWLVEINKQKQAQDVSATM